MREYIHDYQRTLDRELHHLESDTTLQKENTELLLEFYRYNKLNGVSVPRLAKQLGTLRLVSKYVDKPYAKSTRQDYEKFILYLMEKKRSSATVSTYMEILKVFHKWLSKSQTYPECVSWMKCNGKKSKKLPENLLIQEDVKLLLAHAKYIRDRALIAVLWESGARIGEIGGMGIKDVQFDEVGCRLTLDGKTGMRRIRIINAAPILLEWLNKHPKNNDPSCPVFINLADNYCQRMSHRGIMKTLKVIGKKAGLTKPVNPHHFRHSRATYMSQFLTESQLKEYFGWVQESKMAARYVHLSGKQVEDAILRMHGLAKEDRKEDILKNTVCPRCKQTNTVNNSHCLKCWLPLTEKAAFDSEERKQKEETGIIALMKLLSRYRDEPEKLAETIKLIERGEALETK